MECHVTEYIQFFNVLHRKNSLSMVYMELYRLFLLDYGKWHKGVSSTLLLMTTVMFHETKQRRVRRLGI
jgi:hypothetical protein